MTGALDSTMRGLASDLAGRLGKTVTYVEVTESFDPATGQTTTTTTETQLAAVPPQSFNFDRIDDSVIKAGDAVVTLPVLDMPKEPTTDDRLKMDGTTWQIVRVKPVASGENFALYEVQIRQ